MPLRVLHTKTSKLSAASQKTSNIHFWTPLTIMLTRGKLAQSNKTHFFYVLYSDRIPDSEKMWVFDRGLMHIIK